MADNEITIYDTIDKESVKAQIFEVRGCRVMLDRDIAIYFGVETGALNRAMKRNIKRFPVNFCFQLTDEELSRCQSGISMQTAGMKGGRTYVYGIFYAGVCGSCRVRDTGRLLDRGGLPGRPHGAGEEDIHLRGYGGEVSGAVVRTPPPCVFDTRAACSRNTG